MGPRYTSLQLLGGDWLIRIPVLYLTAEDTRKITQKQGSATDAPRLPETPGTTLPLRVRTTAFCLLPPQDPWVKVRHGRPQNCLKRVAIKGCHRVEVTKA